MPTLGDEKIGSLYAMFKGEPGTRKSTQALSFPTPQYWVSTDKKMNSLILPGKNWGVNFKEIDYDNYENYSYAINKLEKMQINCKYKTIIIDSVTSMADTINRQTMKAKSGETTKEGKEKGNRVGGIPVNTMEDYKAEASAFSELIAITKQIKEMHNTNIILIAHVIGERQTEGSTHFARIICTGGKIISAKIPAYCEETYHFNVIPSIDASQEGKYGLFTVHTGNDFARTMIGLPREIVFNDRPIYRDFIAPAIKTLNEMVAITPIGEVK